MRVRIEKDLFRYTPAKYKPCVGDIVDMGECCARLLVHFVSATPGEPVTWNGSGFACSDCDGLP